MPSLPNELWWKIIAHAISLGSDLAMINPSSERLHPFFPGSFSGFTDTHFYSAQLVMWKRSNIIAYNFVQVNRLWRSITERFLYSAFYVEEEWRVQRFINTIKLNPNLADQLRTLVILPRISTRGVEKACFDPHIIQVLSLCHGILAIVVRSYVLSSAHPLLRSPDSSRRLHLLSALHLQDEEFPLFMINFNHYESLQVLELSVTSIEGHTLPSFPGPITFPSLHALLLGYIDPFALNVVGKWVLPSLKELSISRWNPIISTALYPLIQRSYERLEFLDTCVDLLHDRAFYNIIRAPPSNLRNVTLNLATSAHSSPPMHPATKPLFRHVVTLGIGKFGMIRPGDEPAWVRFFSDTTYMPHLRSVVTDVTMGLVSFCVDGGLPLLEVLRALEKVLEGRGVAFKGVTDDNSTFVPIKLPQRGTLEVRMFLFSHGSMLISSPASECRPWKLSSIQALNLVH